MTIVRLPHTARRSQIAQVMNNFAIAGLGDNPVLNLDFTDASMDLAGRGITFTRASSATRVNASGLIELVGNDVPRRDYDPIGLYNRGLLIEEQRTNSIRNSEAGGASAGTPGTIPTNWNQTELAAGLTRQIVAIGSSNGLNYLDIRISGTTGDALGWQLEFEQTSQISASIGQNWNNSFYCYLIAGSVANVSSFNSRIIEGNPGYLAATFTSFTPTDTSNLLAARRNCQRTLNKASTTSVRPTIFVSMTSGVAVDFTLRIAAPQMEGNTCLFPTSYIPTTAAAVTRAADVASMTGTNFSSWFNATEGTFVASCDVIGNASIQQTAYSVNNGTSSERMQIGRAGMNYQELLVSTASGIYLNYTGGVWNPNTKTKIANAYKNTDYSFAIDGSIQSSLNTAGTLPSPDRLTIGTRYDLNTCILNGHIQRLTYYNKRLPDATLQALST